MRHIICMIIRIQKFKDEIIITSLLTVFGRAKFLLLLVYRIRACVQISETDFKLAHKLVAHLYYQYLYRDQPISFQDAPEETLLMAFADVFEMLAGDTGYLITLVNRS